MTPIETIVRERELRREGALAILMHAVRDLRRHGNRDGSLGAPHGPGVFLIELMWAVEESDDGIHFDVEQARANARAQP